jgi:uncharacterized membrane-anchored protein
MTPGNGWSGQDQGAEVMPTVRDEEAAVSRCVPDRAVDGRPDGHSRAISSLAHLGITCMTA